MQQQELAAALLRRRRAALALIVALALGLNLWYIWLRDPAGQGAGALLGRRSAAGVRVEPQGGDDARSAAFLYSNADPRMADTCHTERDAEFEGEEVLKWGSQFMQDSPEKCCDACRSTAGCNVWVFCGGESGCPQDRARGECWLKKKAELNAVHPQGRRVPGCGWVSGALFTEHELLESAHKKKQQEETFEAYLEGLRQNESLPLVHFDIKIKGWPKGRIQMVLFPHISPRAAENFRLLCTGERGMVPEGRYGAGKPYHYKGAYFYRIIDQFIDQAGIYTESVFGGEFRDDPGGLALKHDRKGLLSMANTGPNTNTGHFSIMMGPAPHLDGHYTIFGQVVSGFDVVDSINVLSVGKKDNTAGVEEEVVIADAGQTRPGTFIPDLSLGMR